MDHHPRRKRMENHPRNTPVAATSVAAFPVPFALQQNERMKRILTHLTVLCACLTAINTPLMAQVSLKNTPTDSLERVFNAATSDTARLSILLNDRPTKYLPQADQLIALYQKGYNIAHRLPDNKKGAKIANYLFNVYLYAKKDQEKAIEWCEISITMAEKAKDYFVGAMSTYGIGIMYANQGNKDKQFESFLKATDLMERAPTPSLIP